MHSSTLSLFTCPDFSTDSLFHGLQFTFYVLRFTDRLLRILVNYIVDALLAYLTKFLFPCQHDAVEG